MRIIEIPHATLRQATKPIVTVDKKLSEFIAELETTLAKKDNPRGVGLAAPQVDKAVRIFSTQLPPQDGPKLKSVLRTFINPEITDRSQKTVFGPNSDKPQLEGCLSIPGIYGPVPRWLWVKLKYFAIEKGQLVEKFEYFENFAARVVQHEFDHLFGKLFIDYSAELDLPLYQEDAEGELVELSDDLKIALVAQSQA